MKSVGDRAEEEAARYLEAGGFVLLWKKLRLGPLELDLVARKGPLVVVVEVRTRSPRAFEGPLASIRPEKQARLLRAAARLFRERLEADPTVERIRIDVAAVSFGPAGATVEYFEGAITGS